MSAVSPQPGLFFSIGGLLRVEFQPPAKCERAAGEAPVTVSGLTLFVFFFDGLFTKIHGHTQSYLFLE